MENSDIFSKLVVQELKTQSDYLADNIKDMIISGELPGGYTFPNENEFCKQLNVGRGTLREAYKTLKTQGFILRTKHGTYIKKRKEIANQGDFQASLELAEKTELIEFVCALESEAVALVAQKITDEQLNELKALIISCEESAENTKVMLEKNYEVHKFIRHASNNHLMISALTSYYNIFEQKIIQQLYHKNLADENFKYASLKQHWKIYEALESHDTELARKIAFEHLQDDIILENQ